MATATHQITWESFQKLPDGDGFHRELIEGELQILPPVKPGHSRVAKRIFKALLPVEERAGGHAYIWMQATN
jgi:Uma2 family endonuclease